jgi:hypothetical protein
METLSTKPVDNSVENRGSFGLSARSVSGPLQNGEKTPEIEFIRSFSSAYELLWMLRRGAERNIASSVTNGVRKSLILALQRQPCAGPCVESETEYTHGPL